MMHKGLLAAMLLTVEICAICASAATLDLSRGDLILFAQAPPEGGGLKALLDGTGKHNESVNQKDTCGSGSGCKLDPARRWKDNRFLSTLGAGIVMTGAGQLVDIASPNGSPAFGAGSFDRFFRDALRSRSKHDNFFNGDGGALYAPALGSLTMLTAGYLRDRSSGFWDSATGALPLLWVGIGGSDLFTASSKKGFGRKRPYFEFSNQAAIRTYGAGDDARESFYSGHASTAFFTARFTDRVLADIIRSQDGDYCLSCGTSWPSRLLRIGQSSALYGLATYVAYSRIEIDKHYMTDALAGGLVGGLLGELTYAAGYQGYPQGKLEPMATPGGVGVRWRF